MIDHNDQRLTAYVLGELNEKETAVVEQAIAQNPELRQCVDEIRLTTSLLEDEFAAEPSIGLSDQQKSTVFATTSTGVQPADRTSRSTNRTANTTSFIMKYWPWMGVAACVALVVLPFAREKLPWGGSHANQDVVQNSAEPDAPPTPISPREEATSELSASLAESPDELGRTLEESDDFGMEPPLGFDNTQDVREDAPRASSDKVTDRMRMNDTLREFVETEIDFTEDVETQPSANPTLNMPVVDGFNGPVQIDSRWTELDVAKEARAERPIIREKKEEIAEDGLFLDDATIEHLEETDKFNARGQVRDAEHVTELVDNVYGYSESSAEDGYGAERLDLGQSEQRRQIVSFAIEDDEQFAEVERESLRGRRGLQTAANTDNYRLADFGNDAPETAVRNGGNQPTIAVQLVDEQVTAAVDPATTKLYSLAIPEQTTRTESYTVRVPVQQEQTYTVQVPTVQNGRTVMMTETRSRMVPVMREETRTREVPVLAKLTQGDDRGEASLAQEKAQPSRQKKLAKPISKPSKPNTWRRVKAVPNTSRLMIGDKDELHLNGMQVHVQVDGFRARVLVDYMYFNDRDRQLEGKFKIRLPDDASLYYFAFGQSAFDLTSNGDLPNDEFLPEREGTTQFVSLRAKDVRRERADLWRDVKEARMVPREQAAFAYGQTVRRRVDPALVEWSGAGVFNANVFPLMPKKLHRIVIGYDVNLTQTDDGLAYELTLPEQTGKCKVEISVEDVPDANVRVTAASKVKQKDTSKGQRFRVNKPQPGDAIRLTVTGSDNVLLRSQDEKEGDFFATRIQLDLPHGRIGQQLACRLLGRYFVE